jgi:hypothetical protein
MHSAQKRILSNFFSQGSNTYKQVTSSYWRYQYDNIFLTLSSILIANTTYNTTGNRFHNKPILPSSFYADTVLPNHFPDWRSVTNHIYRNYLAGKSAKIQNRQHPLQTYRKRCNWTFALHSTRRTPRIFHFGAERTLRISTKFVWF